MSGAAEPGPDGELALTRTVSAVTGACLCLRRSVFFEIGQLDEQNLAVSFNDIDLCLRAGDHGYRVVFTPFAGLTHYESATRRPTDVSAEERERYIAERTWFEAEWGDLLSADPFHNPNVAFGWNGTSLAPPAARHRPSPKAGMSAGPQPGMTAEARRLDRAAGRLAQIRRHMHHLADQALQAQDAEAQARRECDAMQRERDAPRAG